MERGGVKFHPFHPLWLRYWTGLGSFGIVESCGLGTGCQVFLCFVSDYLQYSLLEIFGLHSANLSLTQRTNIYPGQTIGLESFFRELIARLIR